jgi:hypothetical protein
LIAEVREAICEFRDETLDWNEEEFAGSLGEGRFAI